MTQAATSMHAESDIGLQYKPHPIADIFPLISGKEFVELKEDIRKHGVLQPVVLYEGRILDGRNRYRAAQEVGAEIPTTEYLGNDPVGYVVSMNLARRHLNESQRAMIAAELANMPPHRPPKGANLPPSTSAAEAARKLNVSERSVKTAKKVKREAIPEVVEKVQAGEMPVSVAAKVAELPEQDQEEIAALPPKEAAEEAKKRAHVAHNSGNNEWYTPPEIIEAARAVMGGIDLDPASSEIANRTVRAARFFTEQDNGLEQNWQGRVWLNPPYAQPAIRFFAEKLIDSLANIDAAIVLVNNATETRWFQHMASRADGICFFSGRVRFLDPYGNPGAPLQGQAALYFGDSLGKFNERFSEFGFVVRHV